VAAIVGAGCTLAAPWLATFFHISTASIELAAGLVFFGYAMATVLGLHFDLSVDVPGVDEGAHEAADADPVHPLTSGLRELLLPFVVSPLAIAAALTESLATHTWGGRWTVAGAFVLVVLIDMLSAWVFAPLLGRAHEIVLEVLSRLLGVLLAAVGVELFLDGLTILGVLHGHPAHLEAHQRQARPAEAVAAGGVRLSPRAQGEHDGCSHPCGTERVREAACRGNRPGGARGA
jgi:multiple antibiotic resistance protein